VRFKLLGALLLVGMLVSSTQALAYYTSQNNGTGGGITYYFTNGNVVAFSISWSDNYTGKYNVGWYGATSNDYNVWGENQGGCNFNASVQPFGSVISGYVQYHWNGGTGSAIYATYAAALCNSHDRTWGSGNTTTSVLWFGNDPYASDYVDIESTWACTACTPSVLGEGRNYTWR
jgi:hypothetical protein